MQQSIFISGKIKEGIKEAEFYGLNTFLSRYETVAGSYAYDNETLHSVEGEEFPDYLSE
jgi:hypothetical protein